MKENKLGVLLGSFKDEDWKCYQKFAKSRYSDNSDYKLIIDQIKKHKDRYDTKNLDSEYLRKQIRPSAKPIVFSNVISKLCKHIEAYFIWAEIMDDPMMEDTLLLKAFGKRGLTVQFHKQKKKSEQKRDQMPLDLWAHYHEFLGAYLEYFCNMTSTTQNGGRVLKSSIDNLNNFKKTIDKYLFVEVVNRKVLTKENWGNSIQQLENSHSQNELLDSILTNLISLKEMNIESSFFFLKGLLKNISLSIEIRNTILVHLLSFISKQNTIHGENKFTAHMIELQEFGIKANILFPNGKIPFSRYLNIIHRACYTKQYDWAINFTKKFSIQVFNDKKYQTQNIGIAYIEFSRGNFEKVIDLLSSKKYHYIGLEYRAKWLLLSSNFELNKDDLPNLEYNIRNFKSYINRNKKLLPSSTFEGLKNSSTYLLKIANYIGDQNELINFKKNKKILYHTWLNSKAEEKIKR